MEERRSGSQDEVGGGGPDVREIAMGTLGFSMAGVEKRGRESLRGRKSRKEKTTEFWILYGL
jgi:hypothetical protein